MELNQTHPGNAVNEPTSKTIHNFSKFNPKYAVAHTARFGELTPFLKVITVPKDRFLMKCSHNLETYTLKAPLMSNFTIKKDYFSVPMQAILPFNWEKIYKVPAVGDDVPSDAYTSVEQFFIKYNAVLLDIFNYCADLYTNRATATLADYNKGMTALFTFLVYSEYVYSNGSLLNLLGCKKGHLFKIANMNIDKFFDIVVSRVADQLSQGATMQAYFPDAPTPQTVEQFDVFNSLTADASNNDIVMRDFLQRIREFPYFYLDFNLGTFSISTEIAKMFQEFSTNANFQTVYTEEPLDLLSLHAYQMVCSHFYSNDYLDYIYSAELHRQLFSSYVQDIKGFNGAQQYEFTFNGVKTPYDYLSAHFLSDSLAYIAATNDYYTNGVDYTSTMHFFLARYLSMVFPFRRSLKFVDYFTGSRSQPLAVGDYNVAVNSNLVSVIDITKSIQFQRLGNAVARVGNKIESYVKEQFGIEMAYDYHNPAFLGHTSDEVFDLQTDNTGADQFTKANSVSSRLKTNNSDKFAFEFDSDRYGVILGIEYFDLPRSYYRTTERDFFVRDRFDMFIPQMQYIGDQAVYNAEVGFQQSNIAWDNPFSYQLRDMQFKSRFNQASGGFVENLPGWLFLADSAVKFYGLPNINPDFIRSKNVELDEFYVSMTGYSLASYFHFAIMASNFVDADRPMAFAPTIL